MVLLLISFWVEECGGKVKIYNITTSNLVSLTQQQKVRSLTFASFATKNELAQSSFYLEHHLL